MAFPKPDDDTRAFFESLVPDDPRVEIRPMFGNIAAFVNRNMYLAVFGNEVAVRLPEDERAELLAIDGAAQFEPMSGRPMKEYVSLPFDWRNDADHAHDWAECSFEWASSLPPKVKKARKAKKPKA